MNSDEPSNYKGLIKILIKGREKKQKAFENT